MPGAASPFVHGGQFKASRTAPAQPGVKSEARPHTHSNIRMALSAKCDTTASTIILNNKIRMDMSGLPFLALTGPSIKYNCKPRDAAR
jgi:hypothetical protein